MQYKIEDNATNYFSFFNGTDDERKHCANWNEQVREAKLKASKLISDAYTQALGMMPVLDGTKFIDARLKAIEAAEAKRELLYTKANKKIEEMALLRTAMKFTNATVSGTSIAVIASRATSYLDLLAVKQVANEQGRDQVEQDVDAKIEELICGDLLEQIEQHYTVMRDIQSTCSRANGASKAALTNGELFE